MSLRCLFSTFGQFHSFSSYILLVCPFISHLGAPTLQKHGSASRITKCAASSGISTKGFCVVLVLVIRMLTTRRNRVEDSMVPWWMFTKCKQGSERPRRWCSQQWCKLWRHPEGPSQRGLVRGGVHPRRYEWRKGSVYHNIN